MALTPRHKALAWALGLLTLSTIFMATALATTDSSLRPLLRGEQLPHERSLNRDGIALGVHVRAIDGGDERAGPIEGAMVKVFRVTRESPRGELVREATTDDKGVAVVQLRPGNHYRVAVQWGDLTSSSAAFPLRHDARVGVAFDEEGNSHWVGPLSRRDQERRGEAVSLYVHVGYNDTGNRTPASNASVTVYGANREIAAEGTTGPRGWAVVSVPRGEYTVRVVFGDANGTETVTMRGPMTVGFYIDGDEVFSRSAQGAPNGRR